MDCHYTVSLAAGKLPSTFQPMLLGNHPSLAKAVEQSLSLYAYDVATGRDHFPLVLSVYGEDVVTFTGKVSIMDYCEALGDDTLCAEALECAAMPVWLSGE